MSSRVTPSFKHRILRASAWTFSGHFLSQAIRLASNLIMTRLLVPEMFGVMAIASVVMMGLALFSDFGLRQNVIQSSRGSNPAFLNTIWAMQIIRGGAIWIIALLISLGLYYAAKFEWLSENSVYANPILPLVIVSVSLTALISGFESTRIATANRLLVQGRFTVIELASQLIGVVVMVIWAVFDRSIWALVVGGIVTSLVKTVCSHTLMPGERNQWMWDKSSCKEIFQFGKWVFVASILGFLVNNGDRLLLGWLVDAKTLGIYVVAFFIMNSLVQVVSKLMGSVMFPVLSEVVRTNPEKLAGTYYRFRFPLDIGLLFFSGLLFEAGRFVIYLLYDVRYAVAGPMLELLSLTLIAFRYNVADQCFLALGRPGVLVKLIVIRAVTLFVLLPLAFNEYQMSGALWAIVISSFSSVPLTFLFKKELNLLDMRKELIVMPVFLVGAGVGFIFEKVLT